MTALSCPVPVRADAGRLVCAVRWDVAAMILVVGIMLFYYTGIIASDDLGYLQVGERPLARATDDGVLGGGWYYACRFVHWVPVKLVAALPPHHPWMLGIPSLIWTVVMLLTIRSLARRYLGLGELATAASLLVWGLTPTVVMSASVALPDVTAAALAWLGVYCVLPALLNESTRRPIGRCVAGGFLIALAYSAKETTLALVPGLILFVFFCQARSAWAWRRAGWLVAGAVLWIAIETAGLWLITGHPTARFEAIRVAREYCHQPEVEMTATGLARYWTDYVRWMIDPRSDFGVAGPVLLLAVAIALFRRTKAAGALLWLVAPTAVYLSVGSVELKHYTPVFHQSRYFLPVLPALALVAGIGFQRLQEGRCGRPAWMLPAAIGLFVLACLPGPNRLAGRWSNAQCFTAGYDLVSDFAPLREPSARWAAAGLTRNRYSDLRRWLDCPPLELALPAPADEAEWVERYGGAYVITTRFDRLGDGLAKHDRLTLKGGPMEALSAFEHIARREPARDRLSSVWARLTGGQAPTIAGLAVDLWRVPTAAEWAGGRTAPPGDRLTSAD